jgi:Na+/proline symporter
MFCCRSARAASLAMIASSVGLVVAVTAALVGLGLYAFYQQHALDPADVQRLSDSGSDSVFVIFIIREIPAGLTGLILAGVFAAAISSLDSVLAALSQTVISGVYRPWRDWMRSRSGARSLAGGDESNELFVSRVLVVVWGVALCGMAHLAEVARQHYGDILQLALAMGTYTGGAILAALLLALLCKRVDAHGLAWSAPLSVLAVFAVSWHAPWAQWTTLALAALIVALRTAILTRDHGPHSGPCGTIVLIAAVVGVVALNRFEYTNAAGQATHIVVAWPWNVPLGLVVALALGYLLAGRRPADAALPRPTESTPGC